MNKACIIGKITRLEGKETKGGMAIAELSVCVKTDYRNEDKLKNYSFFDVTFFGKRAEALLNNFSEKEMIGIAGSLTQDRWEQEDGTKRSKVKIIGDNFYFVENKFADTKVENVSAGEGASDYDESTLDEEDLPF